MGILIALLFVTLPFVVRAVQPVLLELDRDMEEAAASLGANDRTVLRRIILPNLVPAILTGCALVVRTRPSVSSARSCSSPATCRSRPRWPP